MAKAPLTDGLLSVFPAADACPADLCVVGKLLAIPAFCLPVSAEEVSAAPVQKQGVVVQNVLHRDAVKGGELVRKFGREAAVKCAAFQIPIEPFLHEEGLGLFPIRCGGCSAAGCRTRPPCGRRTYPLLQCGSVWYTELDNSEF